MQVLVQDFSYKNNLYSKWAEPGNISHSQSGYQGKGSLEKCDTRGIARIFQRGVTLCQTEGHGILAMEYCRLFA